LTHLLRAHQVGCTGLAAGGSTFICLLQREGVEFVFECLTGKAGFEGSGCVLADDMVGIPSAVPNCH